MAIDVKVVSKSYGKLLAVDGLSFSVKDSTCYALLGPNGAGKTTMMKMIYGRCVRDDNPLSSISVNGYDPSNSELEIKYLSGVVPQENNIDAELDVIENLLVYSKFYGIKKDEAVSRIEELMDFMELSDKIHSKIRELSGGMKRRLLVVRALLNRPSILIMDEPTTGLDPQVRHIIWEKIRTLKKSGTTILITTHYMDEAFNLADRILIMNTGRNIMEGNPRILLDNNMEGYVLEIFDKEIFSAASGIAQKPGIRIEVSNDMCLLYSDEIDDLKLVSERLRLGTNYLRQSNLEDLFLKITGRFLNEKQ